MRPKNPSAAPYFDKAGQFMREGRTRDALNMAETGLRKFPDEPTLLLSKAAALSRVGAQELALPILERVAKEMPDRYEIHMELGTLFHGLGQTDDAEREFRRAHELEPERASLVTGLASVMRVRGDHEGAMDLIEPYVLNGTADGGLMTIYVQLAKRLKKEREGIERAEQFLNTTQTMPFYTRCIAMGLGALYDTIGEPATAMEMYRRAGTLIRNPWDPAKLARAVDTMIERWTPEVMDTLRRAASDSRLPVFVCGMPRSGTTLVEQIIASHPDAHGGSEIGEPQRFVSHITKSGIPTQERARRGPALFDLLLEPRRVSRAAATRFAKGCVDRLSALNPDAARVTDKLPQNFMHLGLIHAVLPNAPIVWCQRHPLGNGLSCYATDFRDAEVSLSWTLDLRSIGAFYNEHRRLMTHWTQTLGIPVHTVRYESMVADQLGESRRLLDAIGLGWHENCARFYEKKRAALTASEFQVDRPIYTDSLRKHERYGRLLDPLRDAVDPRWIKEADEAIAALDQS